jgi:hypothetical protein
MLDIGFPPNFNGFTFSGFTPDRLLCKVMVEGAFSSLGPDSTCGPYPAIGLIISFEGALMDKGGAALKLVRKEAFLPSPI